MNQGLLFLFTYFVTISKINCSLDNPHHDFTDYCEMLGQDDIQGMKHGFLAGKNVYYIGGRLAHDQQHETIGLTHPFFHDLRSRGTGIVYHEGVGTGNDFYGWEFYKDVKAAWGSIITPEMKWENPAPSHMYWSPDKMRVEYILESPYLPQGEYDGWCKDWEQGSTTDQGSFWVDLSKQECWNHCLNDAGCYQAVFEVGDNGKTQCWIGLSKMITPPDGWDRPQSTDTCFAKEVKGIENVNIIEEKFISNDVVTTRIFSNKDVTLEISGRSFQNENAITLNGSCSLDVATNSIFVTESGRVIAKVQETPEVLKEVDEGVCGYSFTLPLSDQGVTLSWSMDDDANKASELVQRILSDPVKYQNEKKDEMNDKLNTLVPFFRCSDHDIVRVYYYLWSLFLMYYTGPGEGMRKLPTTQTAVNNFLGLHRFDAGFQILVGSWINPAEHEFYANGNVLSWAELLPYRVDDQLPDNFGVNWASGVYGPSTIAHVLGAWQIFEHSADIHFLEQSYQFYKELYWEAINGKHWLYAYDAVLCLNKMAEILGFTEDPAHWNETVNMQNLYSQMENQWELETPGWYGSGMGWGNVAPGANSMFPREWLKTMAEKWLDNQEDGFFGTVPLTRLPLKDWEDGVNDNFAVVPDANWYMIRGLYLHTIDRLANKFTLAHLKGYNMENGVPVAPEGRDSNFQRFGDKYSNFNAGKILLLLEGIGGLKYTIQEDTFIFAENLPQEWDSMEYNIPVPDQNGHIVWVIAKVERYQMTKTVVNGTDCQIKNKIITVENNPFSKLIIRPWLEEGEVLSYIPGDEYLENSPPEGHIGFIFNNQENMIVDMTLCS